MRSRLAVVESLDPELLERVRVGHHDGRLHGVRGISAVVRGLGRRQGFTGAYNYGGWTSPAMKQYIDNGPCFDVDSDWYPDSFLDERRKFLESNVTGSPIPIPVPAHYFPSTPVARPPNATLPIRPGRRAPRLARPLP